MNLIIDVYDRVTRQFKYSGTVSEWRIEEDLLSSVASEFNLDTKVDDINAIRNKINELGKIKMGDIVLVSYDPADTKIPRDTGILLNNKKIYRKLYYGIITTKESYKITCKSFLFEAWNCDFPLRENNPKTEDNPFKYFNAIWETYIKPINGLYFDNVLAVKYDVPLPGWKIVYDPDSPEVRNLASFASYMFKQVQHVPTILGVAEASDGKMPDIVWTMLPVGTKETALQMFASDKSHFNDINVFESDTVEDIFNCISVWDSAGEELDTYYIYLDGKTIKNAKDKDFDITKVRTPVVHRLHQLSGDDSEEYAKQQLGELLYNHEIEIQANPADDIFLYLQLGHPVFIRDKYENHESIITSYTYDSENEFTIKCGNVRTTLESVLDGSDKD